MGLFLGFISYSIDLYFFFFFLFNVGPETIKLLEENIGRILDDINQSKILYDPPSRVTEISGNNKSKQVGPD